MGIEPRNGSRRPEAIYFAALAALILLGHLSILLGGLTPVLEGRLPGQDSYMRLLRVERLHETWAWFDGVLPRSNWPHGEEQNWTRPFDVLLLGGALVLEPLLGFQRALFWWGSAVAPLLHVATALALAWAVAPFMPGRRQLLAALALIAQVTLWPQGVFGRADHHMLILLVFVLSLGGAARVMAEPARRRGCLLAGMAAGFGMWLTVEFLLVLAVIFGAFTLRWLRFGAGHVERHLWHALGLTGVMALALLADRPPGTWFADEYDRISIVHLWVGILAVGFWAGVAVLERRRIVQDTARGRALTAGLGAIAAAGAMQWAYPKFFSGPFVDFSAELWAISTDLTKEFQPLMPSNIEEAGVFLFFVGPAVFAVPYLAVMTWRARGANLWDGWLLIALGLLIFVPLTLEMRRFSAFAALLLAVVMADIAARLLEGTTDARRLAPRVLSMSLVAAVFFGHSLLGGWLQGLSRPEPARAAAAMCPLDPLLAELRRPDGLGSRAHTVLWHPNHAPMLLYLTRHNVVSTLYARNASGQLDAHRIYTATDWQGAREIVKRRGIDIVVACMDQEIYPGLNNGPDSFESRLRRGEAPPWLSPVELIGEARDHYRVYRVAGT